MTTPHSGSRTCAHCGGVNYGALLQCILCGAPLAPPVSQRPSASEPQSRWAPRPAPSPQPSATPPHPASVQPTQPISRFCPSCGQPMKSGVRFCRACGFDVQTRKKAAPPAPRRAESRERQSTAPVTASPSPAPAKPPSRLFKGVLRVVIPIVSLVVTYYLTNKVLGPMLAQRFGDASRQLVPLMVSMAVGGMARQVMK